MNLSTVREAIAKDDAGKWSVSESLSNLQMDPQGRLFRKNGKNHLAITDHALRQLCQRVIPYKGGTFTSNTPVYLRRQILNFYLKKKREGALVRGKSRYIRAILSDDFTVYDNEHLITALSAVLSGLESKGTSHAVRRHFLSDQSLWIDVSDTVAAR